MIDCDNFKTKAAQALRDEARAAGMIPVPAAKMETLRAAVPNILTELARYDVTLGGEREMRFEWDEAIDPVNAVACSGYIDHWEELRIDELKSGSSITSIEDAAMLLGRTHALLQDAAYRSALADFLTCEPESIEVRFVFFQTEEPFAVTPVTLSGPLRQVSYQRWHRALRLWNACLSKGTEREFWPGPVEAPHSAVVDDPGWMLKREIEMEAREDE